MLLFLRNGGPRMYRNVRVDYLLSLSLLQAVSEEREKTAVVLVLCLCMWPWYVPSEEAPAASWHRPLALFVHT